MMPRSPSVKSLGNYARPHHDQRPGYANSNSDPIPKIRVLPVDEPAPKYGENNEDGSVRGIHSTEGMNSWLKNGNDSVQSEANKSQHTNPNSPMLAKPKPDEITPAYFKEAGKQKQSE